MTSASKSPRSARETVEGSFEGISKKEKHLPLSFPGGVANDKLEISVGIAEARLEASGEVANDKLEIFVKATAVTLELSGKAVPAVSLTWFVVRVSGTAKPSSTSFWLMMIPWGNLLVQVSTKERESFSPSPRTMARRPKYKVFSAKTSVSFRKRRLAVFE